MKRLNGAEREGMQNNINAMFSSTDKICQVPTKDGRTIQRNIDGTETSFHNPDVGFRIKAQFDSSLVVNQLELRNKEITRTYPWHSGFVLEEGTFVSSTPNQQPKVEQLQQLTNSHPRKLLQAATGEMAHLRNLKQSLSRRLQSEGSSPSPSSSLVRGQAHEYQQRQNGATVRRLENGASRTIDGGGSVAAVVHASPWLEERASHAAQRASLRRNPNLRGAGHVRTMAQSNTPKPLLHPRLGDPSFEWATTGASMEVCGGTSLSAQHGRHAVESAAATAKAQAATAAAAANPVSFDGSSSCSGGSGGAERHAAVLRGLALPQASSERTNAVTKLSAEKWCSGGGGVPVTVSYQKMDVALPKADKALNPFGRPARAPQQGFLAATPHRAEELAETLRTSTTAAAAGEGLGAAFVAAVVNNSVGKTSMLFGEEESGRPLGFAPPPPFTISLRPNTSAAAFPSGWPVGGYYSRSNSAQLPSASTTPTPSRPATSATTGSSGRASGGASGRGCVGGAGEGSRRVTMSREAARSLSSLGLNRPLTTSRNNPQQDASPSPYFSFAPAASTVGVGGTQQRLEDGRFEARMQQLATASAQHHRSTTSAAPPTPKPPTPSSSSSSARSDLVSRGMQQQQQQCGSSGSSSSERGRADGGFHLSQKLAPRDTHNRVFASPASSSRNCSSNNATLDAEAAAAAMAHAVDPKVEPPRTAITEAKKWGELTSVLDNFMHPSNNPNRKYPTPDWAPPYVHTRKAFKLRV